MSSMTPRPTDVQREIIKRRKPYVDGFLSKRPLASASQAQFGEDAWNTAIEAAAKWAEGQTMMWTAKRIRRLSTDAALLAPAGKKRRKG
jgi:hypothetical protein